MRNRLQYATAKIGAAFVSAQGVVGVGCVAAGVYRIAGLGWALIVVGAFLLVGALFAALLGGRR